jgi:hypothetical protein
MWKTVLGRWQVALVLAACGCQSHAEPRKPAHDDGMVTIRLRVRGRGQVAALDIARWCDFWCVYKVARGTPVRFRAVPGEDMFYRWKGPCGSGRDCFFAPLEDVTLEAAFEPDEPGLPWDRSVAR